jgi:hypothetical protein
MIIFSLSQADQTIPKHVFTQCLVHFLLTTCRVVSDDADPNENIKPKNKTDYYLYFLLLSTTVNLPKIEHLIVFEKLKNNCLKFIYNRINIIASK